ncbi:MAG: hypothetical protein OIF50_16210 [Flavobacteriaceae bacterium]|nr:hypothetical protein [Flavobacteriaceae bacterium]
MTNELEQTVNSLEKKVQTLLQELVSAKQTKRQLLDEIAASDNYSKKLEEELNKWEEKYSSLKMASSMLNGGSNKTEAKRKINHLIQELDYCIAQLSE